MSYLGDIVPGQTLNFKFTTVTSSGAPVLLTGTPSLVAWKDASVTSSTAGLTLTASFGGITGSNHVNVSTGADGTFYSAGSDFMVGIAAGTAGGVSVVGYVVGEFSINNRSALRPTTASRTLNVATTGQAGVNWADVAGPTTTVSLTNTSILDTTSVSAKLNLIAADLPIKITKNVALPNFPFFMVSSATHTTGATGLTITATRRLDNGAFAACANTASEVANGWYTIDLANTDTNGDTIAFFFTAPTADPLAFTVVTQPT